MSDTTNQLKDELKKGLSQLQTLRDEVRVRLHLASMDIKSQWDKLEPQLLDVEKEVEAKAEKASEATKTMVSDAVKRLQKFRESLQSPQSPQ